MYLLIACASSWLSLLGAFFACWVALGSPRSTSDLLILTIVGAAAVLFTRIGVVSLLALLLRLLPYGRLRSALGHAVIRIVPTMLRSSVVAVVSMGLAVNAAHAYSPPFDAPGLSAQKAPVSSSPADPGWPTTTPDEHHSAGGVERDAPPDPAWPSTPADDSADDPDAPNSDDPDTDGPGTDGPGTDGPGTDLPDSDDPTTTDNGSDPDVHIVGRGESLWSIAAGYSSPEQSRSEMVEQIFAANRDVIGPDPNLIMPGQRLEVQP